MEFDRGEADDQFFSDLLVAEAFHYASQHLAFAFGQVSANFFGRNDPAALFPRTLAFVDFAVAEVARINPENN